MQIDSYDSPDSEALLRVGEERLVRPRLSRRELITHSVRAGSFLVVASLIAALAPWHPSLSASTLVFVVIAYAVAQRVKFPVMDGWTAPTELAFVPALFVLPTPLVPLVIAGAILVSRVPDMVRGRARVSMLPAFVGDAWYTVGPALVLILANDQLFTWAHWPIYICAFLAQVLFDAGATVASAWFTEGIKPRIQLPLLSWMYLVDAALAPIGVLVAAAASGRPGLLLLALSPLAMLWLFARERKQRLDDTVALSTAYRGTALLLGDIVEADDHYTGMHSREVVDLSVAIAVELGLDASSRRNVEFAALLHDVGKIRIPKEIINKPGSLDENEWAVVRQHPVDGEEMLQLVGGTLASVGRIVRASHERYDGNGYPDGLRAEEIPIEARIIGACDAYSAMTTDRSYRKAMSREEALRELHACAGSQFDANVVAAIERLLARRNPEDQAWLELLGTPPLPPRQRGPAVAQPQARAQPSSTVRAAPAGASSR